MYGHLYKYKNYLNKWERVQVIREYDSELPKPTILALANKYNVKLEEIQNILAQRDSILQKYEKIGNDQNRKRNEKIEFLGRVIYEYIQRLLFLNLSIDDKRVLQKAMEVKTSIAVHNFRPNAAWLKDFKRMYGIPESDLKTSRKNITITGPKERRLDTIDLIQYIVNTDMKKKNKVLQSRETVDLIAEDEDDDDVHDESIVVESSGESDDDCLDQTDTDEDEVGSPSGLSACNGKKTKSRRVKDTISTCELNKIQHKETTLQKPEVLDENIVVLTYEVSDEDIENHVDLKSALKIEVAPTQLIACNVTDLQTRSEGLQDIDKKKSEENNFSENDLLAINQIIRTNLPAQSAEEEIFTLYEIVDDKDKNDNDNSSESPTIKIEPEEIDQTIKIEPSELMETNDNEELTSSPPLESLNIKTESIKDSSVNKSKGQNLSKEKEKLIEKAIGETVNSQKGHLTEDSLPDIDCVEEAMRYIKILENYVMLKENYRAIGLISQLENAIKNPAKE